MPLAECLDTKPSHWESKAYEKSVLNPVAPEYTTGEVFLGAAYRTLVLGIAESEADMGRARGLALELPDAPPEAWECIVGEEGALRSPQPSRERTKSPPLRLMPLVPAIASFGATLGSNPNRRWNPGAFLLSTVGTGAGPAGTEELLQQFAAALAVDDNDDLLARFLDARLPRPPGTPDWKPVAPAWRSARSETKTPAEQFCRDLETILALKPKQTRRQWTAVVEALLRLGMCSHMLWLCRLNKGVWDLLIETVDLAQSPPIALHLETTLWEAHWKAPLLELGTDAVPWIKRAIRDYAQARLGINLLLRALLEIQVASPASNAGWTEKLGSSAGTTPAEALASFLGHVAGARDDVRELLGSELDTPSLKEAAGRVADRFPKLLSASDGFAENTLFFLRHGLGQLQTKHGETASHDQAYLLARATRATNSPWPVQPGPVTLMLMAHACSTAVAGGTATIEDFRHYLACYGIHAPVGELQAGKCARDMESLGLVVDSPDAGGGRLLVDPF